MLPSADYSVEPLIKGASEHRQQLFSKSLAMTGSHVIIVILLTAPDFDQGVMVLPRSFLEHLVPLKPWIGLAIRRLFHQKIQGRFRRGRDGVNMSNNIQLFASRTGLCGPSHEDHSKEGRGQ